MAKAKRVEGISSEATTTEAAQLLARTRLAEMYEWHQYVDEPYRVRELHNLRIAAKRLRYTLEIFQDALPVTTRAALHEVEQIQEELGALHDSDVMIALLRLCLGGQDSGPGYEYALAHATQLDTSKGKNFSIYPQLVAYLLDPESAPSARQRHGLELLLRHLQPQREEQYQIFRAHWYQLKMYDFQRTLADLLTT